MSTKVSVLAQAVSIICVLGAALSPAPQKSRVQDIVPHKPTNKQQGLYPSGVRGGILVTAQRSDPRSFNPIAALDTATRELIGFLHADLIHINRKTSKTEPALAESWDVSTDGLAYTVRLRSGLRFSDNHPMDADDVLFTFRAHLDAKNLSSQRDLLVVNGKPIQVTKLDQQTVRFRLSAPYAAAERLFDGIVILPRHLLSKAYDTSQLLAAWPVTTSPEAMAGMGPFRLKRYVSGERVVLERNPFYWRRDNRGERLPFLDEIVVQIVPTEDAQAIRFQSGALDLVSKLAADTFMALRSSGARGQRVHDAGPGLEYSFLVFNMNERAPGTTIRHKQKWFKQLEFRRAVSAAIDRDAVVRLVYKGLADPIFAPVTQGNPLWANTSIRPTARSLEHARELLRRASFSWKNGALYDRDGEAVSFSLLVSTSSSQRGRIATIIQDDLRQLGMQVSIVSLDSRATQDKILNRQDYDAAVMALSSGDADPNSDSNVWLLDGTLHMWNRGGDATPWEREIDTLMRRQMITMNYQTRKQLYDQVQQVIYEHLPIVCIASPHVLTGASERVQGFHAVSLPPHALWNADELYLKAGPASK